MKHMKNGTLRGLLALVLSCCLLFGMVGAVFAEEPQDDELNSILSDIQGLMSKYGPTISTEVQNGTTKGTRIPYVPSEDSYYVAIGDASVRETATYTTYVSLLAKELEIGYKNLGMKELLIEAAGQQVVAANEAEIKKADLVSLGFSVNGFALVAMDEVLRKSGEPTYLDWSLYLPEEGVAEVKATLARMKDYLKASGVDGVYSFIGRNLDVAESLVLAAESFAFGTLAYANTLPKLVDQIHAINPDATVAIVGMDNPLDGSSVKLSSGEIMDLGSYVDKLISFTSDIAQTIAIEKDKTVFVSAPDASNANDGKELGETDLLMTYMPQNMHTAQPDAEGQEYISKCVKTSLRALGDVNNDGIVNYADALLALRASIQLEELDDDARLCADVDHSGRVDYQDALKILRASIGLESLV